MDKFTDYAITSHQGVCDSLKNKIYYLNECADNDLVNDNHRFVIRKSGSDYIIDSIINENLSLDQNIATIVTSVCLNNNSEVETTGNVRNVHTINQGDNSSFDYTFKRYYSTANKMYGCQYESSKIITLLDMFNVVQNGTNVDVVSLNADGVEIDVSELDILWRINDKIIDILDGKSSVEFTQEALALYTDDDEARISVEIDGVRFNLDENYLIDRNNYQIISFTQMDYIDSLEIYKKLSIDHNYEDITTVALFIDGAKIDYTSIYNEDNVGKEIVAVMYKSDEPEPVAPFTVHEQGIVFIKTITYIEETVSDIYINDGYFDLSIDNGTISGINKSIELPVQVISKAEMIVNFTPAEVKFFSESEQLLFDSEISPDSNGIVLVKNETGVIEPYRLEDFMATELVYKDQEELYVFSSKSSYESNTYWDIPNIDDITFEIDTGRVYGPNLLMTYDADQNEALRMSLRILWLESISGSEFRIYGLDANGIETLYVLIKNLSSQSSSIFNAYGTRIMELDLYRYLELVEFKSGTKKIRIETNNSNIMFENLQITLARG